MYIGTRSGTKKVLADPRSGLARFDEPFAGHGRRAVGMLFKPDQFPRSRVLGRVFLFAVCRIVMLSNATLQILGLANVKPAIRILQNVRKKRQTPRVGLEPTT